ncbi:sensor histidine kinase [Paenibacillus sp. CGMCC 1.16610]|uniref:histidine kinase n=1 Tax=Paenibacillus anseongense TaxID=2682845 RepID=A0ABW9UAU5_9BACL|nr:MULTISPECIES: sensor histidine kinase [Paenibacillus]MBA2938988.1 sensor histidine kinase [Paenibacillus sp. CGMCC 1.16610]MVQ34950.1 HAMP domain-containing protein [Paenibacillus anseongense]
MQIKWQIGMNIVLRYLFLKDQSLITKLLVFSGLLVVVPMVTVGSISYLRSSQVLEQEAGDYSWQIIEQVKSHIEYYVLDFEIGTLKMINHPDMGSFMRKGIWEEGEKTSIRNSLQTLLNNTSYSRSDISGITIILDNMEPVATSFGKSIEPMADLSQEYWYKSVPTNGEDLLVSRFVKLQDRNEPVISIIKKLVNPYTLESFGLIITDVNFRRLKDIADKVIIGRTGAMYILDSQGHYVYHPDVNEIGKKASIDNLTEMLKQGKGTLINEKKDEFVTYSKSQFLGWTLYMAVPYSELSQGTGYIGNTIVWTTIITLCIAYIFGVGFASSIIRPIRNLQHFMKKVEIGVFSQKVAVESRDEIGMLTNGFNKMVEKLKNLLEEIYFSKLKETEMSLRQKETELKVLQSQVNPHFLFNSLETIRGMSLEYEKEDIADMALSLAKLLRYNLKETSQLVTVKEELSVCKRYLRIQKYRFDNKLEYDFDMPDWVLEQKIVKFSLQPIVENCVIHGIEPNLGTAKISISATSQSDHSFQITVSDSGAGIEQELLRSINEDLQQKDILSGGSHIGIINVHRRIELLCGEGYGLFIESKQGKGTSVNIKLPKSEYWDRLNNKECATTVEIQ